MAVKALKSIALLFILLSFNSCSVEDVNEDHNIISKDLLVVPETKTIEIKILELINAHRINIGLKVLNTNNTVKAVAFSHTNYMVEQDSASHHNFYLRKLSLQEYQNAKSVSENVAYGFNSAQALVNAWLNSKGHRDNIEGDFTDFDISAEQNSKGRWYFTNLFIRK